MPYEMLEHLKGLFDSESKSLEFDLLRDLLKCRLPEGGRVSEHVLKMIGLIERLAGAGIAFETRISVYIILQSLPDSYSTFIVNYNMNAKEVTLSELHSMLKTYEKSTSKGKSILMVNTSARSNFKGKNPKRKNKLNNKKET